MTNLQRQRCLNRIESMFDASMDDTSDKSETALMIRGYLDEHYPLSPKQLNDLGECPTCGLDTTDL